MTPRRLWQCSGCRYQVSVTAGTVLHKTRIPLPVWFRAAYLVTNSAAGVSARQLQHQLGLGRYETAWTILHKLRHAMVVSESEPLRDVVEVDLCSIGGQQECPRATLDSRQLVAAGVEVGGAGSGRVRLKVIDGASPTTFCSFVAGNVAPGAIVHTDGWPAYRSLARLGYQHRPHNQRRPWLGDVDPYDVLPRVHRLMSDLKTSLQRTHRGVSGGHLHAYLDEYAFRCNRQGSPSAVFHTLLGLSTEQRSAAGDGADDG